MSLMEQPKRKFGHSYREKTIGRPREKMAVCKPRNKVSEETNPTLNPNLYPPELGENK